MVSFYLEQMLRLHWTKMPKSQWTNAQITLNNCSGYIEQMLRLSQWSVYIVNKSSDYIEQNAQCSARSLCVTSRAVTIGVRHFSPVAQQSLGAVGLTTWRMRFWINQRRNLFYRRRRQRIGICEKWCTRRLFDLRSVSTSVTTATIVRIQRPHRNFIVVHSREKKTSHKYWLTHKLAFAATGANFC